MELQPYWNLVFNFMTKIIGDSPPSNHTTAIINMWTRNNNSAHRSALWASAFLRHAPSDDAQLGRLRACAPRERADHLEAARRSLRVEVRKNTDGKEAYNHTPYPYGYRTAAGRRGAQGLVSVEVRA